MAKQGAGIWPLSPGLLAAEAWSTASTPTFPTTGTVDLVAVAGVDFAVGSVAAGFAFTASGCLYTYTGPTIVALLMMDISIDSPDQTVKPFAVAAIDVSGDLIGQDSNTDTAAQGRGLLRFLADVANTPVLATHSMRIAQLASGATIRPCLGANNGGIALGADTQVERLNLTIIQLGLA